jgi:predicted permease
LGILVALTSVRGIFVDLTNRKSEAPLQWFFDGLYTVGLTAVPINMMILGCNLDASQFRGKSEMSFHTMLWTVLGKMVILPFLGIFTCWLLKTYCWEIPDDIDGSVYLVLMIVFLCPTANNVMVMVELSGSSAKEGMARLIALQYACAPVILSLTMTVAIGVASGWS